uniref:Acetyl-coenzyme A carboxylase carboxyl transferase subunit beta, chloroplastic n=1 Tax=Drosera regia TaxID=4371 RepID=A0A1Z2RQZ7_DRORE|nr:acetyl-CoA carboxylase beta subunit [Drosera regia]ASA46248.1 acetyl-CoA carboxylase beta subunit [Drosera regia]
MTKWLYILLLSKEALDDMYELRNLIDRFHSSENTSRSEDRSFHFTEKQTIHSGSDSDSSSYSNMGHLFGVKDIEGDVFFIYLDIEKQIFQIDTPFLSALQNSFSNYWHSRYHKPGSKNDDFYDHLDIYTKSNWYNHINNSIDNYLHSQMCCLDSSGLTGSDNSSDSSFFDESYGRDFTITENLDNLDGTQKYRHLWLQCENCYGLNYKKFLKSQLNICEQCRYHLKMSSSERIELLIDPDTWYPMDEDMVSTDPIEFHSEDSEEESYKDRIDFYQRKTGLNEAVQTGIGKLNDIPVAIGIMDFQFLGGSMGSVVGEKITRLIEYATKKFLPLIIVSASGGARMQEGSLSLMQMAKISSALYDYQSNKKLFYVSILTSPTTGGVTASFGMLGDIIIAEPNAYIAFAGKRVIEQTLNTTVPEGSQEAEYLFEKGLLDSIVPRNLLKGVLTELFQLHDFFPLNQIEYYGKFSIDKQKTKK